MQLALGLRDMTLAKQHRLGASERAAGAACYAFESRTTNERGGPQTEVARVRAERSMRFVLGFATSS